METKTEDTKARAVADHKLKGKWSTNLLISNNLRPDGEMDLTPLTPQGNLRMGKHNNGSIHEDINGQATPITLPDERSTFAITIQTADHSATFNGVLLKDTANAMTIVGFFVFADSRRTLDRNALAQNEGVWVMTKP